MEDLSFYLKKFRRIISSNEDEVKIISEEVSRIINFSVLPKDIRLEKATVFFQTKSTIKNEIFIHKEEILRSIRDKGIKSVSDLR